MTRTVCIGMAALAALLVTGCATPNWCPPPAERTLSIGCAESAAPLRLDRGDWLVSQRTAVWKVLESQPGLPPKHVGFVTERKFRQMRGGPAYGVYEVTTLNRKEQLGRIDQMGRAFRYDARRNDGFEEVDLGTGTMEVGVAAILETPREVFLEQTTERRLAFEILDTDGNGLIDMEEAKPYGDRLTRGDRNRDGNVDFQEFDAIDVL